VAAGALLVREAGGVIVTVEGEQLLPLSGDVEQVARSAVTASGPDESYVRELAAALLNEPEKARAAEGLSAEGLSAEGLSAVDREPGTAGSDDSAGTAGSDDSATSDPDRTAGSA